MPSEYQKGDQLECPKCHKPNDLKAEYCWACYFDFISNDASLSNRKAAGEPNRDLALMSSRPRIIRRYLIVSGISLLVVLSIYLVFKGIPVPDSKKEFIGGWINRDEKIFLNIRADGQVSYKKSFSRIRGRIQEFNDSRFTIRGFITNPTFEINEPPTKVNEQWEMVINGYKLQRYQ